MIILLKLITQTWQRHIKLTCRYHVAKSSRVIQKWAATWLNQQSDCPPSLIRVFACAQWLGKDPRFRHADSEDSDQTWRMPRLIRVCAGRTHLLVLSWGSSNGHHQNHHLRMVSSKIYLGLWMHFYTWGSPLSSLGHCAKANEMVCDWLKQNVCNPWPEGTRTYISICKSGAKTSPIWVPSFSRMTSPHTRSWSWFAPEHTWKIMWTRKSTCVRPRICSSIV